MSGMLGEEINLRVEIPNDLHLQQQSGMEVGEGERLEDGELSSLSDSEGLYLTENMEVDSGVLGDNEDSPLHPRARLSSGPRVKFQPSRLATEGFGSGASGADMPDLVMGAERKPRQYENPFKTDEGRKKVMRSKRFADSPYKLSWKCNEVIPTDEELLDLYKMCGLFSDDWSEATMDKVGSQYRLDSILMRGINNMSTDDVFLYLYQMGLVPEAMEWVNDACAIAVYKDKYEAAASLQWVTKPISVDHEVVERKKNLEIEERTEEEKGEGEKKKEDEIFDYDSYSVIPYEKVKVPMPLGYVWRYAQPCEKTKGVLMRFATINDKKQEKAERYSEYYKKHGNPNNPYYRPREEGPPKKKRPFKRYNPSPSPTSSEEEEQFLQQEGSGPKPHIWASLSAKWSNEESENRNWPSSASQSLPEPSSQRPRLGLHPKERLGQGQGERYAPEQPQRRSVFEKLDVGGGMRKRIFPENMRELPLFPTTENGGEEKWTARLSGPTMRMHADEEESRQKLKASRKKQQQVRVQVRPSLASRLGGRVGEIDGDLQIHVQGQGRRVPVRERLGAVVRRPPSFMNASFAEGDDEFGGGEEEEEYLESLLRDDE